LVSANGSSFNDIGEVNPDKTNFVISNFATDSKYCFRVRANLEGGKQSTSNNSCILTNMQRPPGWINADYATVISDKEISLSFTIDPSSEITHFLLEKKDLLSGTFKEIARPESVNQRVLYSDKQADIKKVNYYRLSAINSCSKSVITSNLASNLLINLERDENRITLFWDAYNLWQGVVSSYTLFINTGNGFEVKAVLPPTDTLFTIDYSSVMYDLRGSEVCFSLSATEINNPHGITGITSSSDACTFSIENITVPNVFSPNNDLVNDLFKPVLSFTPKDYHLTISNISGNILFETNDFSEEWDGSYKGNTEPEGVYLWYLKVTTPSGKGISQKGTVTIISN
jgi:gliding motility-associated-like protein